MWHFPLDIECQAVLTKLWRGHGEWEGGIIDLAGRPRVTFEKVPVHCGHDIVEHDLMGELSICYMCEDFHRFVGRSE